MTPRRHEYCRDRRRKEKKRRKKTRQRRKEESEAVILTDSKENKGKEIMKTEKRMEEYSKKRED